MSINDAVQQEMKAEIDGLQHVSNGHCHTIFHWKAQGLSLFFGEIVDEIDDLWRCDKENVTDH